MAMSTPPTPRSEGTAAPSRSMQRRTRQVVNLHHGSIFAVTATIATVKRHVTLHHVQPTESDTSMSVVDEELTSEFVANTSEQDAHKRAGSSQCHHRRGSEEADNLASDIFALGKKMAEGQQRQRVSISAAELELSRSSRTVETVQKTASRATQTLGSSSETVKRFATPSASSQPSSVSSPDVLTGGRSVRSSASKNAWLPQFLETAPQTSLPPLQSWEHTFVLTPQQLQVAAEAAGASEVAYTLEELENTLFTSPFQDELPLPNAQGPEATPSLPPSPPSASDDIHVLDATMETGTEAPRLCPAPNSFPTTAGETGEAVGSAPTVISTTGTTSSCHTATPVSLSTAEETEMTANATLAPLFSASLDISATAHTLSTAAPSESEEAAPVISAVPSIPAVSPVLKCRLCDTTVIVSMTRHAPEPRALLDAMHEAVTFSESLPPLPQEPREVHLEVDSIMAASAGCSFLETDAWAEILSSTEERVSVHLLKERLLQRMTRAAAARELRYVAVVRVPDAGAPVILRNFSAELLLACGRYVCRSRGSEAHEVDEGGKQGTLQLSFCGIAVGIFPASSTARTVMAKMSHLRPKDFIEPTFMQRDGRTSENAGAGMAPHLTVSELMRKLHVLPPSVSDSLLMCHSADGEGFVEERVVIQPEHNVRWWTVCRNAVKLLWDSLQRLRRGDDSRSTKPDRLPSDSAAASMLSCITTTEVWDEFCESVLRPSANKDTMSRAVLGACHSAPLRRCREYYQLVAPKPYRRTPGTSFKLPFVIEVSRATLQRTSVADLASVIREQPSDVLLVFAEDVPGQQKISFLASLHLINTGSHHRVTVLLPGDPHLHAECVSLTQASAHLISQLPHSRFGSSLLHPTDAGWLHQMVEVRDPRSSHGEYPFPVAHAPQSETASLAALYVEQVWQRPYITTQSNGVGSSMAAALLVSWQRLSLPTAGLVQRRAQQRNFLRVHLRPLVWSSSAEPADNTKEMWWTSPVLVTSPAMSGTSSPTTLGMQRKALATAWPSPFTSSGTSFSNDADKHRLHRGEDVENGDPCGVAFLFVLDAACQSLLHGAVESPAQLDVLSIAALALDPSAGGVLSAADRLCGGSVDLLLSQMEAAAATHGIRFASLPLLCWMGEEKLLFSQLTVHSLDRFRRRQHHGTG